MTQTHAPNGQRRKGWYLVRDGALLTLSRHLPARFDVVAETTFPDVARGRLAHQVRQDLWRACRHIRGFSPVVEVRRTQSGIVCRAGGQIFAPYPAEKLLDFVVNVLTSGRNKARWTNYARHANAPRSESSL